MVGRPGAALHPLHQLLLLLLLPRPSSSEAASLSPPPVCKEELALNCGRFKADNLTAQCQNCSKYWGPRSHCPVAYDYCANNTGKACPQQHSIAMVNHCSPVAATPRERGCCCRFADWVLCCELPHQRGALAPKGFIGSATPRPATAPRAKIALRSTRPSLEQCGAARRRGLRATALLRRQSDVRAPPPLLLLAWPTLHRRGQVPSLSRAPGPPQVLMGATRK